MYENTTQFIHCRHLYSASSSGDTPKRSMQLLNLNTLHFPFTFSPQGLHFLDYISIRSIIQNYTRWTYIYRCTTCAPKKYRPTSTQHHTRGYPFMTSTKKQVFAPSPLSTCVHMGRTPLPLVDV